MKLGSFSVGQKVDNPSKASVTGSKYQTVLYASDQYVILTAEKGNGLETVRFPDEEGWVLYCPCRTCGKA